MLKSRKLQRRAPETGGCGSLIKDIVTGLTGAVPEYAVKKNKSHRRLSPSINLPEGVYIGNEVANDS